VEASVLISIVENFFDLPTDVGAIVICKASETGINNAVNVLLSSEPFSVAWNPPSAYGFILVVSSAGSTFVSEIAN